MLRLDDVYCDINGERYRTEEWGLAMLRMQRLFKNRERKRLEKIEKFDHGATVPPCGTCELIVPLLLCPGERKKCSHKS